MNTRKLRVVPAVALLLPADIVVGAGLLLTSAITTIRQFLPIGRRSSEDPEQPSPVPQKIATIQILNWDGKHLLAECLPSVIEAVRATNVDHEILVVDNGSTDGSVQFLRERFPQVRIVELDRNYGFVGGNNRGVQAVSTDIVVFLNNDMIVRQNFLQPLLDGFTDASIFAVTSQIFFEDASRRREETGKTRGRFERGFFNVWHEDIDSLDAKRASIPVFWAGGGACAFDRRKYLTIQGLDEVYGPFYVEDTDLSYRAWKRGWKCLLAPASQVVHKHRATSSRKYSHRFVDETIRRNLFLFIWKNVTSPSMLLQHIWNLPRIHGSSMLKEGCRFELRAYRRALGRLPAALWKRLNTPAGYITDDEVLVRSQL
jgi:GT2 family glycosyltransferase